MKNINAIIPHIKFKANRSPASDADTPVVMVDPTVWLFRTEFQNPALIKKKIVTNKINTINAISKPAYGAILYILLHQKYNIVL